jgi:hypothetical protein
LDRAWIATLHRIVLYGVVHTQVEIAGIAATANKLWMSQIGRNVTDAVEGILKGKRYLIHDRDPLFTPEFLKILAGRCGVGPTPAAIPESECICGEIRAQH